MLKRCFGRGAAATALDNPVHDGKPDTGSFVILASVQPLEDAKQFVGILHVEAGPVVADEEDGALAGAAGFRPDFEAGVFSLARIPNRVAPQVHKHLLPQQPVNVAVTQLPNADL